MYTFGVKNRDSKLARTGKKLIAEGTTVSPSRQLARTHTHTHSHAHTHTSHTHTHVAVSTMRARYIGRNDCRLEYYNAAHGRSIVAVRVTSELRRPRRVCAVYLYTIVA